MVSQYIALILVGIALAIGFVIGRQLAAKIPGVHA